MKVIFRLVSIIFHPILLVMMMLGLLIVINPILFAMPDANAKGLFVISVFTLSIMFPVISVFLMKQMGFIQSWGMKNDKERVGPLIVTGIFYLWLYVNIKNNLYVPQAFSFFVLGTTIGIFLGFFINNFTRISIHAIGISGLLVGLILVRYNFSYGSFLIDLRPIGRFIVNIDYLIMFMILMAGLVGTSRLYLNAHSVRQVYEGYFIGAVSQLLAFMIFF